MAARSAAVVGALLLAWASQATCFSAEGENTPSGYKRVEPAKAAFACEVPSDWAPFRDSHDEERTKIFGLWLTGPKGDEPIAPHISLRYFTAENSLFPSAAAYLKRQLQPGIVQVRGEKTSAVAQIKVGGLAAKTFTRDTFEYWPPESLDTRQIKFRQEYVVMERAGGFYVLIFAAPTSHFENLRPVFQHVLDTFRPK